MSTGRVVYAYLRAHPEGVTTRDLCKVAGASDQVVRYHLRKLNAVGTAAGRRKTWRLPPMYRVNSDRSAAVSTEYFWLPIDKVPPPLGPKLLLINESAGVAVIGQMPMGESYWTHWAPLPRFVKDEE